MRVWGVFLAAVLLSTSLVGVPAASAADTYDMIFPHVGGVGDYSDTFGDPRSGGRTHAGTDIMAPKMTPIVAVASGTVGWMHADQGGNCCAMALYHDDGWESWYIHMNNDTEGTDDGQGWGFAPGIEQGVHVEAGELIGWVGDSGNAEGCNCPHTHFELHEPDGTIVNPYTHLLAATVINEPNQAPEPFDGAFRDDDGSVHEVNIDYIFEAGVTQGCAFELYCPADDVTRGQMALFLARALDLPLDSETDHFSDDDGHFSESAANKLADLGITTGCEDGAFCPDDPVTRGQMATFLVRSFDLPPVAADYFSDDTGLVHEESINALAVASITTGCTETAYCPHQIVRRDQMASFLARALGA